MPETTTAGPPQQPHSDISRRSLIERLLPAAAGPYVRLARLDRPIGTWLLLFPCWWALILATPQPDGRIMLMALLFAIGAVVMRGAGCTINDILDRDLDALVERTRSRPLPSGEVSLKQAILFLLLQLAIGLAVLVQFSPETILMGVLSLALVFTYPLMKRITWWPQLFLGLTFNWGALLGWVAVTGHLELPALLLYAGGIFWTLGYDTIYAHQDRADDLLAGVKSSALRLGESSPHWIAGFYVITSLFWFTAALLASGGNWLGSIIGLAPTAAHFIWQLRSWRLDEAASSLAIFRANRWLGWLALAGFGFALNPPF
jgi:4-hydroxybenzoate polyprenyltransferase